MPSKVILKNDGIFVYEDFTPEKISGRLRELLTDQVQPVRRTSQPPSNIVAYMISDAWYQAQVKPLEMWEEITDDYFAHNFSTLVNIVNATPEVKAQQSKINEEGPSGGNFKGYIIINTKKYYVDENPGIVEESVKKGEAILGRFVSKAHYEAF